MISVRRRPTVFLDAVFKPFLKIVYDTGQQLTMDWMIFLTDGFLQIIQRTGFVSVITRFLIPPKGWESEGATTRLQNGKWGAQETFFRTAVIDSFAVCAVAPSCWWAHIGTGKECRPPRSPLGLPTEYYPFKRCQIPVGHPVQGDSFTPRKYTFSIYSLRCRPTSLLQCNNLLHNVSLYRNVLCFPFSLPQALTCVYKH